MKEHTTTEFTSNEQKNQFDITELAHIFLWFAVFSPIVGFLFVKVFKISFDDLGVYGDLLGGSTLPFLTFASLLLLLRSINIQQNQLKIQKEEVGLVRVELEEAKNALQEQSNTARISRFENTFYMLNKEIKNDIQSIKVEIGNENVEGYQYLYNLFSKFRLSMKEIRFSDEYEKDLEDRTKSHFSKEDFFKYDGEIIEKIYYSFDKPTEFNVFMDHLEQVFHLLDRNKSILDTWELDFYLKYLFNIVRKDALYLWFIHTTFTFDNSGIDLIKRLGLLNYISKYDYSDDPNNYNFIKFVVENNFDILQ